MKEIFYDYEEFKKKVSVGSSIHYDSELYTEDKGGTLIKIIFRLYGCSNSTIMIFEIVHSEFTLDAQNRHFEKVKELSEKYAHPLNATLGRWEE